MAASDKGARGAGDDSQSTGLLLGLMKMLKITMITVMAAQLCEHTKNH